MKKTLLVVEDQADIRKLITMTLDFGDYDLHEAEDGMRGLHLARGLRPSLVLLDVMMPGELDGYQVCSRIKEDPSLVHTRVILLTARGQQSDLAAGKAAGADAYITKPFSPLELIDTVERLLPEASPELSGYRLAS
jgi:CheY-like chemotaxis protein